MINSFRRTGDGEADGSGRGTGKRTEAAAAVRAVRLFGRRQLSSPWPAASRSEAPTAAGYRRQLSSPWPAASRSEAPTAAGASSFLFLVLLFLRLSPVGGSGWKPSHRRRQNPTLVQQNGRRWFSWSGSSSLTSESTAHGTFKQPSIPAADKTAL